MPGLICKCPVFALHYFYIKKESYVGFLSPLHSADFIVTDVPFWQAENVAQHFHH